ncbi:helix-turn-helix domain-containing protein [Saccharopolyspora griseoalba]|uniref:Helix-turn-helix domain-containing protein n=1 Tax=Saccharopolyspora griseoalba TaxID=1431848 RepID=A0ABW2LPU1_9PSEU
MATIADEIIRQAPELTPLEVWRLAYGWSRPQVVAAISELYTADGLAPPGVTTARLCRWEHDGVQPDPDYATALARVYQVPPQKLGLNVPSLTTAAGYGRPAQPSTLGAAMADTTLTAVADSVQLQRDLDGPAGGPATREHVQHAVDYYARHYSSYAPSVLAGEIHRARQMVVDMLTHPQPDTARCELRRLAGWLSALLGNLAFHTADYAGAHIHLGTGARLGTSVGETHLTGWSLGAQSMVASFGHRPTDALELAHQAHDHADTPLRQAQISTWCELRALSMLGRHREAATVATRAQHHMDRAADQPGRFGFDRAEFHQHLAEAALRLGDTATAEDHAATAVSLKRTGSPGWAAVTIIRARAAAADHASSDATALAARVLDAVAPEHLRETTRQRLAALNRDLHAENHPGPHARELHDRLHALPAPAQAERTSSEPNGH